MNPLIQLKQTTSVFLIAIGLACFALAQAAQAVTPPPDGGYPGFNTAEGDNALLNLTIGNSNTATGYDALFNNTTGSANTATGYNALSTNTIGANNTANGLSALNQNTSGNYNTGNGANALQNNTTGSSNTATGQGSLFRNTTGDYNTAIGAQALNDNNAGSFNTATGYVALFNNTIGNYNTANGVQVLYSNMSGIDNTASGASALNHNTSGSRNTAVGEVALFNNTTGNNNTAVGFAAGYNLTTGRNNINIGNAGAAGDSNKIRIGTIGTQTKAFIAGIHGVAVSGQTVFVSGSGQLGVAPSSERFKETIKPMDKASESILALKPVSFHYKKELDPDSIPQFGLVAEDVEKVNCDLIARDKDGKPYTVRYDAVNAMLLNEFLKEHKAFLAEQHKVQELEANAAQQERNFTAQQKQIDALTAGLQKVSAQIALSKFSSQTVRNGY